MPYNRRVFNQKSTEVIIGIEKNYDYVCATAQQGYSYGVGRVPLWEQAQIMRRLVVIVVVVFPLLNSVGVNVEASM